MSITPLAPPAPARRGHPLIAWLVILGVVVHLLYRNAQREGGAADAEQISTLAQARYLVGAANLKLPGAGGKDLYKQAEKLLERRDYEQRLRFAIVAGELTGDPAEASRELAELEDQRHSGRLDAESRSVEVVRLLQKLYAGYEKGQRLPTALSEDEQQTLRDRLGWFGELALTAEGGDPEMRARVLAAARRTVIGYFLVAAAALFGLAAGLMLIAVVTVLVLVGRLHGALRSHTGHGGVYAETFALYMVYYIGLSELMRFLPERIAPPAQWRLSLSGLTMLLSLSALVWPVVRGVSWRQVKDDLGLSAGRRWFVEVLCGVGCYVAAIPALFVGVLIMFGMMQLAKRYAGFDPLQPGNAPSHPIAGVVLKGNWLVWLQVFVLASVLAPLVEEIMFRGLLYRHLREATGGGRRLIGVLVSVLASSFVFAVIHPQGWFGVPVLMSLACVFALTRELRGSLLGPMVAHGLNNGLTLLLLLLAVG